MKDNYVCSKSMDGKWYIRQQNYNKETERWEIKGLFKAETMKMAEYYMIGLAKYICMCNNIKYEKAVKWNKLEKHLFMEIKLND